MYFMTDLMQSIHVNWKLIGSICVFISGLLLYNEYLLYYIVILRCTWPDLIANSADSSVPSGSNTALKAMFIADTHLLGNRDGHWFDKLRREWQMERSFQSTLLIHSPDVVFVLGDLFDEGKWCSDLEFDYYVQRFHKMFRHSSKTDLQVLVGNHDIGFHYMIDVHKRRRFARAFSAPSVRKLIIRENIFVMLNSMALEGDNCDMCRSARLELKKISTSLQCAKKEMDEKFCEKSDVFKYTRPIILQHFPMYRKSDHNCSGIDSAPLNKKNKNFKPKMDCVSEDSSNQLFELLKPRLIISGHTHYGCYRKHADGTPEWTIPSFSWRNLPQPSFILATITPNNFSINKCFLPNENTQIQVYFLATLFILLYMFFVRRSFLKKKVSTFSTKSWSRQNS